MKTHNNIGNDHSERIAKDITSNRTNHRHRNEHNGNHIRTLYGRLIKKPERLTYN